jgi:uncharacterized repeat protein (TIGR03803 family)
MKNKSNEQPRIKWSENIAAVVRIVAVVALPLLDLPTASAQSVQPIYSFPQRPSFPYGGLVKGLDGNFYGTTFEGGHGGTGAIFKVTTNGVLSMIYSFSTPLGTFDDAVTNTDGAQPEGSLALGPDGNFYGTTTTGGALALGTVFKVTTNGVLTTLHSFGNYFDGATPEAGLTLGKDGNSWGSVTSAVALVTYSGPPVISSDAWSASGGVVLNCHGQTNAATQLWATTDLAVPADWTPIFTNSVTSASGAWQFTDTNIQSQQRYYRLSTP